MQLPGHLVADTLCSDMPVSNQTFVTRINGRCKLLSFKQITKFSCWTVIVFSGDGTLPNLSCVIKFSLNMFETKYCTFLLGLLGDVKRSSFPLKELFL
jgi:hypothetical protein